MKDVERKKKQPDLYFMYGFEEEEKKTLANELHEKIMRRHINEPAKVSLASKLSWAIAIYSLAVRG